MHSKIGGDAIHGAQNARSAGCDPIIKKYVWENRKFVPTIQCFPSENEIVQWGSSFDLCLVCIECICVTHIFVLWVDSPMPTPSHADSKMQAVRPQRLAMLAQLATWRANASSYFLIGCTNIRKKRKMNLGGRVLMINYLLRLFAAWGSSCTPLGGRKLLCWLVELVVKQAWGHAHRRGGGLKCMLPCK